MAGSIDSDRGVIRVVASSSVVTRARFPLPEAYDEAPSSLRRVQTVYQGQLKVTAELYATFGSRGEFFDFRSADTSTRWKFLVPSLREAKICRLKLESNRHSVLNCSATDRERELGLDRGAIESAPRFDWTRTERL